MKSLAYIVTDTGLVCIEEATDADLEHVELYAARCLAGILEKKIVPSATEPFASFHRATISALAAARARRHIP